MFKISRAAFVIPLLWIICDGRLDEVPDPVAANSTDPPVAYSVGTISRVINVLFDLSNYGLCYIHHMDQCSIVLVSSSEFGFDLNNELL